MPPALLTRSTIQAIPLSAFIPSFLTDLSIPGCVTVKNSAGQQFPVANILIEQIAGPPNRDEP
jgi:hypothetical protein